MKTNWLLVVVFVLCCALLTFYLMLQRSPLAYVFLVPLSIALWAAPMVIISVIVFKVMERRRKTP